MTHGMRVVVTHGMGMHREYRVHMIVDTLLDAKLEPRTLEPTYLNRRMQPRAILTS